MKLLEREDCLKAMVMAGVVISSLQRLLGNRLPEDWLATLKANKSGTTSLPLWILLEFQAPVEAAEYLKHPLMGQEQRRYWWRMTSSTALTRPNAREGYYVQW